MTVLAESWGTARRRAPLPAFCSALGLACAALCLASPRPARAEQREAPPPTPAPVDPVSDATRAGTFLPLTVLASVDRTRGFGMAFGGYDSAVKSGRLVSFAEAHVWGPLALRIGAQSNADGQRIGPSVAGRLAFLSERKHGLDAAVSLAYNTEGFTELEGELEVLLALGKSVGDWQLLGNFVYGQDFEGRERDGEVRLAALCHLGSVYYLGLDGRGRIDLELEEDGSRVGGEPKYDVDVGPVFDVLLGPVVVGLHGGLAAVQYDGSAPRFGAVALAGLGTAL